MPFQSEKQRRYLWANEPEIARDWTDTYGSGIHKALGGRIPFRRGGNPHSDAGGRTSRGMDMSGATHRGGTTGSGLGGGHHGGGEWSGPTYSKPKTVTVTKPSHHIGTGPLTQHYNKNLRTLALQDQYRQGAYQRAHPFLSKIRSGLGSLGRGIGHVARNFNPISFAFDNPLMKLLTSGYGRGTITDLFQRNNQNINWKDPDEKEDIAWENINYNPNALTRLKQLGIMGPDILPEDKPYESYFDDRNLMAGNYSQNAVANQMLGTNYDLLDPFQQQQIDDAINTYGTTSLGYIKT
jgi:hypothetical protein